MTLFDREAPNVNRLVTKRLPRLTWVELEQLYDFHEFDPQKSHDIFHIDRGNHLYLNHNLKTFETHGVDSRTQLPLAVSRLGVWSARSNGSDSSLFQMADHIGQVIIWRPHEAVPPVSMRTFYNAASAVQFFFPGR